jgi:hypothetical protein
MIHHEDPLNCEAPIAALGDAITPNADFYVRNHFQITNLDRSSCVVWKKRQRL